MKMSSKLILTLFFVIAVTVVSSDDQQAVLVRFYRDFAQIFRRQKPTLWTEDQPTEVYKFRFSPEEFSLISQDSMTMIHTEVVERSIVYHHQPNFENKGQRYLYRRNPKDDDVIEIELIQPEDLLVREVFEPNRYFYLTSLDQIVFNDKKPQKPYYEVIFKCNRTRHNLVDQRYPVLTYIDQHFEWSAHYIVDLSSVGSKNVSNIDGYVNIRNSAVRGLIVNSGFVITGDVNFKEVVRPSYALNKYFQEYSLELHSDLVLEGRSLKSIPLFKDNVAVEKFFSYEKMFSALNSTGKLSMMFNMTSLKKNLPKGRLFVYEGGLFRGEVALPSLKVGETYSFSLDIGSKIRYGRQVTVINGSIDDPSITYRVEYEFNYGEVSRDVPIDFSEHFRLFSPVQVKNVSQSNFQISSTSLRGELSTDRKFSYDITISNVKA